MTFRKERPETAAEDDTLEARPALVLTDFDRRRAELIQLGQLTQQMPLVLAQLQQLQLSAPPRRRWGMLAYPLILLGISGISSMALPMMLNLDGPKADKAKAAAAESNELVLNATCILGDQRMAIINGRTYKAKDSVRKPNSSEPPYLLTEIFSNRVVLVRDGKQVQLSYTDHRTPTNSANSGQTAGASGRASQKISSAGSECDLEQVLEKLKNGELGLRDIPQIVSGLSRKQD